MKDLDLGTPAQCEQALRSLLWRLKPDRLHERVDESLAEVAGDCERVYRGVRAEVIEQLVHRRIASRQLLRARSQVIRHRREAEVRNLLEAAIPAELAGRVLGPDFHCDAGLGGTARWLRAAGYDARFWPGIDDDELLEKSRGSCSIVLTTDRRMMERAAIRWGITAALLVPLDAGGKRGQFGYVMRTLGLLRRPPRCMACSGALRSVEKEAVRERIPPKTYPRCDVYMECTECGKLFWHGTHWRQIDGLLQDLAPERLR